MSKTQEHLSENPSFRCTESELEAARKEAQRRGMTFSQLVRLAVNGEVKRGISRKSSPDLLTTCGNDGKL